MLLNETDILGGKAIIFQNDFDVWQFRCWISEEKAYVRKSLKTKDRHLAVQKAEDLYMQLATRVRGGEKLFGAKIEEAIQPFLQFKKTQIGVGDKYTIVKGRYDTIKSHLQHFVNYIGVKTKITDLDSNFLVKYVVDGEETNYVLFRKSEGAADSTITNEMSTIGACFRYLFEEVRSTNIRQIRFPSTTKNAYDIDAELVKRQTFTLSEYKAFTSALSKSYFAKKLRLNDDEMYDRQLARHYFLFAANSGMRSGELRQLKWEDLEVEKIGGGNTQEVKLARVVVPALNTKVRKSRVFYCVGAVYLERWGKEFAKHKTGYVFSRDGLKPLTNTFFNKHFRRVMDIAKIEAQRKKVLVPNSLRHFCITQRVMAGCRFEDVAFMCGTSVKQIENTYYHLNTAMMKRTAVARYAMRDGIAVPIVNLLDETL